MKATIGSLALIGILVWQAAWGQSSGFQSVDEGLDVGMFMATQPSPVGDRKITVVRIDPQFWKFEMLIAADHGGKARTARQWATEFHQTAIVNAGMFQADGKTNVGYMKCANKVNNPRFNDDNTFIAFGTTNPKLPSFQIIDRECQDWKGLVAGYENVTQGIRTVDCDRKNRWSEQPRMWSMVLMGMDQSGRALMIFCRSPYTVHTMVDMLLKLDIDLKTAMYLEGGPESSLFLKTKDCELEGFGSYETGFYESDDNNRAWPIPNVIGISKR